MKQPPSREELATFARALGDVRALVKPTMRAELGGLTDEALLTHLSTNPGDLRRPIIVRGSRVIAGFGPEQQQLLGVPRASKASATSKGPATSKAKTRRKG